MVALTNHALDHMLCSVIDANITKSIVRLGSRSSSHPLLREFNIEDMENAAGTSRLHRAFGSDYSELKDIEADIEEFMTQFFNTNVDSYTILRYLELHYPVHHNDFLHPPSWVSLLYNVSKNTQAGWTQVGQGGQGAKEDNTLYAYWLSGGQRRTRP